jgi:hypothetical protein
MSTRFQLSTLTLALTLGLGLAGGCDHPSAAPDEGSRSQADGSWYGKYPNGTGIYIATTSPRSEWGLKTPTGWYYMTGFTHAGTEIVVNGGYWNGSSFVPKKGSVSGADWNGSAYAVREIAAKGSDLRVILEIGSNTIEVAGDKLPGLVLHLRIPSLDKSRVELPYSLMFQSTRTLDSVGNDVMGYELATLQENVAGAVKQPFCYRADTGENELAQFSQGSQWDVMTAARADDSNLVSVSCASGGIGRCEQWGYRPWAEGQVTSSGVVEKLVDAHQSCMYMKRADYCGNGDTYTEDGTMIGIDDNFTPAFQKSGGDKIEALWGPKGAICLDPANRRRLDLPFFGCAAALPLCTATSYASQWYVQSSRM